jgi:CubicO group peptidase (beta-lactamase class C family)
MREKSMFRKGLTATAVLVALLAMPIDTPSAQTPRRAVGASLNPILDPIRARFELPALAAAVVKNGKIVASGAVGTRRAGTVIPVTIDDRFHIGSDTKAMTSLLAAMLVEGGKIRWDSTVAEIFPELVATMDSDVKAVTLEQLLSHMSGIPSDNDGHAKLLQQSFAQEHKNLDELRYWVIGELIRQPLPSKPGTKFAYANMGYTLAGAMLERVSGKTWEELIVARVFDPLGLKSAGLGPQSSLGRVDAPLGHEPLPDGMLKPMLAGPNGDNPEVLGPAGTAHLSVLDFATWAAWNAGEGKRGPLLARPETLRKLHTKVIDMPPKPDAPVGTPSTGSYGFGWVTVTPPFAHEPFLFHGGSNEMNVAYIMLQPKRDFGIVMMTNVGGKKADQAMIALGEDLYRRFFPAVSP